MSNLLKSKALISPGARLKYIRSSLLRLSRTDIEEKYSIPEVTLKSWENSTTKLTENAINRCLEVYKSEQLIISRDWILHGIGLDPTTGLSVSNYFSKPTDKELSFEDDEISMIRDANDFKDKYQHAVVMMVSGDEMRPFFKPGDYVGGKMRFKDEINSVINKDCILYLKDGNKYFRRLIKNFQNGFNLTCLNPHENLSEPVLYNVEIEGAAPIIWHRIKDE